MAWARRFSFFIAGPIIGPDCNVENADDIGVLERLENRYFADCSNWNAILALMWQDPYLLQCDYPRVSSVSSSIDDAICYCRSEHTRLNGEFGKTDSLHLVG